MKRFFQICFWIFLIGSITILVKYSYFAMPEMSAFFMWIFLKPMDSDGIILNLAIGYIVSSIFYLMISYYPDLVRKNKISKRALEELSTVYLDAITFILLIFKNTCNKNEWVIDNIKNDSDFFDERFYKIMQKFDIYETADTVLCKKDNTHEIIKWFDLMEAIFKDFIKRIDSVLDRYLVYLDDELIDNILNFRNNELITAYLGLPSVEMNMGYTGKGGIKYYQTIPLYMTLNDVSGNKKSPIFKEQNLSFLKSYVQSATALSKYFKHVKGYSDKRAYKILVTDECGQIGTSKVSS